MTIKDEILANLRSGVSFDEIKAKYRTKSGIYEALGIVVPELELVLSEKRESLEAIEKDLIIANDEFDVVAGEKEEVSGEVDKLRQEKEELAREVEAKKCELQVLNDDIAKLCSQGYTIEILEEIKTIENRSGPRLLAELKSFEKFAQMKKRVSSLKEEKVSLEEETQTLLARKHQIEHEVICEKNRLDQLQIEAVVFGDAVETVRSLFEDGYGSEEIASLKSAIDTLGIRQDRGLTLRRVFEGLLKQKSLFTLEQSVATEENKLASLNKAVTEVEVQLEVSKKAGLDMFNRVENAVLRLKEEVEQSRFSPFLWRFFGSTEDLKSLPIDVIVQVEERVSLWTQLNLPSASTQPSQNVSTMEAALNPYVTYKVQALIDFIIEFLKGTLIRQSKGQ